MAVYKSLVKKVSIPNENKIKQKSYLKKGNLPVIDQGQELIGGYTNDMTKQIICDLPVVVFGDHTKNVKLVQFDFAAGADGIKILQANEQIIPEYLYYGTKYLTYKIEDKGYARHYQHIEKQDLPVPSIDVQERIVFKIEELFSKLDKGVEELNKIKEQLKIYRQAVLKEAFEGKFLSSNSVPRYYFLENFIDKPRYGTSKKCSYENDNSTPVYRIPNIDIQRNTINKEDLKFAKFNETEFEPLALNEGDILIIRSNGSISLVGRAAIIQKQDLSGLFAGYLMRLRIRDFSKLNPKYLIHFLNSHEARTYIEQTAKSTSGVNNINSNEICALKVPIFTLDEQNTIVREIESRLSVCEKVEQTVNQSLQKAESLRQSILKQAFEGGLV